MNNYIMIYIYDSCVYIIIIINIVIVKILAYYLFILYNRYLNLSNKRHIYEHIKDIKYDIINDFDNYSSIEIKELIDYIIQIYIKYTCDFSEDYYNNIKIEYNDIDVFIITKRKQLIDDIKNNIIVNYKNKENNRINEIFENLI